MPTTFLIAPVRGVDPHTYEQYVKKLEEEGWLVHWPARDTNQDDDTGLRICQTNRNAIMYADAVHVIWDGKSQGCLFDIGIAFALNKLIFIIDLPPVEDGVKSFQAMLRELVKGGRLDMPQEHISKAWEVVWREGWALLNVPQEHISKPDTTAEIDEIVLKGSPESRVFVITTGSHLSQNATGRLRQAWAVAWGGAGHVRAPALLIMSPDMTLTSLTDDKLRHAGLMRIKPE